jgi:hypothetical protein
LAAKLGLGSALVDVATTEAVAHTARSAQRAAAAATPGTKAVLAVAGSPLAFIQGVVVGVLACGVVWVGATLPAASQGTKPAGSPSPVTVATTAPARPSTSPTHAPEALPELDAPKTALPIASSPHPSHDGLERDREKTVGSGNPAPSVATFGEIADPPRVTAQDHQSQLKEEAALLRRARAQLRANALPSALALLDESKRRFAAPELYQEREALLIELLARGGRTAEAAARARAFLTSFPESPHADRLRVFANPSNAHGD